MLKKIYCSVNALETRFVVVENGKLVEILIERENEKSLLGNIYLGRVENIHHGMEYAFVDIGLEKNAFMQEKGLEKLLQGQYVFVQVKKEETNGKGIRVTDKIEFNGKYIVYMPNDNGVSVSRKIKNSNWKELGRSWCDGMEGVIFRTTCQDVREEVVYEEFLKFKNVFKSISQLNKKPVLAYENEKSYIKYIQENPDIESIEVDNVEMANKFRQIISADKVIYYRGKENILSHYLMDIEIKKVLNKRVELENGGFLLIEQMETMTVIDVNTGSYIGNRDKEKSALEINKVACNEIIRQLRLRNIGGMICIDFVNMKQVSNQNLIRQLIIKTTKQDNVKYNVYDFTKLGLLEMTRERMGKILKEWMFTDCVCCNGHGEVISTQERANELISRLAESSDDVTVEVTEDLVPYVMPDVVTKIIHHPHSMFRIK